MIAGIESAVAQNYNGIVTVPIFDGTERVLSWDNIVWITRSVFVRP